MLQSFNDSRPSPSALWAVPHTTLAPPFACSVCCFRVFVISIFITRIAFLDKRARQVISLRFGVIFHTGTVASQAVSWLHNCHELRY